MHETHTVDCPYCGEPTSVAFDRDGGSQQHFVSDCEVCCRPIEFRVAMGRDGATIRAQTEDA